MWEDSVGDHAWIDLLLCIADRRVKRKPTVWEWNDPHLFREDVLSCLPQQFASAQHFESFCSNNIEENRLPLSAKERRRYWEPFRIQMLRWQIRQCEDELQKGMPRNRLFNARVAWARSRDVLATSQDFKARKWESAKKQMSYPLQQVLADGVGQSDATLWIDFAEQEFEKRWEQQLQSDTLLFKELQGQQNSPVVVYEQDVWNAVKKIRRPWRLDYAGVCIAALRMVPDVVQPSALRSSSLLSLDVDLEQVSVQGFVKGKVRGRISMSQPGGLFP